MHIITPDKEFVKQKITEVKKTLPVGWRINRQGLKQEKTMNTIIPNNKLVKRKITGQEKNSAGSLLSTFKSSEPRGDFPASFPYGTNIATAQKRQIAPATILTAQGESSTFFDITPQKRSKNAVGRSERGNNALQVDSPGQNTPLVDSPGQNTPFGKEKVEILGGGVGVSTLLDTSSEISRHRKGQKREKTGVLSVEQFEQRVENCGKYVREFETKCCGKIYYAEMSCNLRTCPFCARKRMLERTRKVVKFVKSLDANREKYGHRLRFITFGYGTKDGVKEGVKKSLKAFELIRRNLLENQRSKERKTKGCVWSVELGPENLSIHIHVLYWGKYIPQRVLSDEWKRLTGNFYVDIRYAKNKSKKKKGLWGVVLEATKYVTKGLINLDTETAFRIERELFNVRTFGTSGIFYGKIKPEKPVCPFCGSDEGFFYVGVEKKSRYVMIAIDIQRQFWEDS